jgi:predicted acylesterase/phospholipase RssA
MLNSTLSQLACVLQVFGGGGARCLAYAGALHSLRTLGLVGRLRSVSGASGGAVYALLAALGLSVQVRTCRLMTVCTCMCMGWSHPLLLQHASGQ